MTQLTLNTDMLFFNQEVVMNKNKMFSKYTRLKVAFLNYFNIHGKMTDMALNIHVEATNFNRKSFELHGEILKRIDELNAAADRCAKGGK